MGSCFIYGGRQLGKTVLLRDVQRQVHDLENNRIAIWLDLKAKGIGYDRPVDDLWVILAGEFKSINILPPSVQVHASPEKIIKLRDPGCQLTRMRAFSFCWMRLIGFWRSTEAAAAISHRLVWVSLPDLSIFSSKNEPELRKAGR